jgi:hypothetical protein
MNTDNFAKYNTYLGEAKEYFEKNFEKIKTLFDNNILRDFILEPFQDIIKASTPKIDSHIYSVITQTALINAVIAATPGKMGIGVFVCIAFEAYMAYRIAEYVGVEIKKPSDIFKHFGVIVSAIIGIIWVFKALLSFAYSLIPFFPLAEFLTTDIIGVMFWVGFKEMKHKRLLSMPKFAVMELFKKTKNIFEYQYNGIKTTFTIDNIKSTACKFKAWITGEIAQDIKAYNGEIFCAASMIYLINDRAEKLGGELGQTFLEAIRLRWSAQLPPDATTEEISELFSEYNSEQLVRAINVIKGKMFELMIAAAENSDGDGIKAALFTDESHPDSDIIFSDQNSGKNIEVSLKATNDPQYIERALQKYPDTPIMTTQEMNEYFGDNPLIIPSEISNEYLEKITHENMDKLLNEIAPVNAAQVAVGGVAVNIAAALWPYTIAYLRKKISFDDYQKAVAKICPSLGLQFVSRISYAIVLGPIFAWYLIARSVFAITKIKE